jgi:two-component system phosphate regulon sensor histidine kinase PhoR
MLAIVAFVGMQYYWLVSCYKYSLDACETELKADFTNILDEYKTVRKELNQQYVDNNKYHISKEHTRYYRDSSGTYYDVTYETAMIDIHKVLNLADSVKINDDIYKRINRMFEDSLFNDNIVVRKYKIKNPINAFVIYDLLADVELEDNVPFNENAFDSIMTHHGYLTEINKVELDSITWTPIVTRNNSLLSPTLHYTYSYDLLDKKGVEIVYPIPVSSVLRIMVLQLCLSVIVSIMLIICFVWQILTIRKQNRLEKMRTTFVHTMIHELKRPIATMKMCVSALDNDEMMADTQFRKEVIMDVRVSLNNLSAYFSKLRDITFNDVEQIPLNTTTFDFRELVSEVVRNIAVPTDKVVKINDVSCADIKVTADRMHMANILSNLIENAVKYSGQEVSIEIDYSRDADGSVMISVSDNGNGIASNDVAHVFDKFYRGKVAVAGNEPGIGLGLAYVRQLAVAHGGTVTVESCEGKGSRFNVVLPQ